MKLATQTLPPVEVVVTPSRPSSGVARAWLAAVSRGTWALLALALIGFTIFAHQSLYVTQPRDYTPNWHGAEWIRPLDVNSSVAYFHMTFTIAAPPQGAYLLVQGWQTYTLYVNGLYVEPYQIDTDFRNGAINLAHLYDLTPLLTTTGPNSIALHVINLDNGLPAIRALVAVTTGGQTRYLPSSPSWHATTEPTVAYPPNAGATLLWSGKAVSDAKWPLTARYVNKQLPTGVLRVEPAAITTPFTAPWLATGFTPSTTTINSAGFIETLRMGGARSAWLRIASTGTASVFVDGRLVLTQSEQTLNATYGAYHPTGSQVTAGIYDLTPYLGAGARTLAVRVVAAQGQLPAVALDVLLVGPSGAITQVAGANGWRASATLGEDWTSGSGATRWSPAVDASATVGASVSPYLMQTVAPLATDNAGPFKALALVALLLALFCALGIAAQCGWRWSVTASAAALDRVALALAPSIGLVGVLLVLNFEPLMPRPFPFTAGWAVVLAAVAVVVLAGMMVVGSVTVGGDGRPPDAPTGREDRLPGVGGDEAATMAVGEADGDGWRQRARAVWARVRLWVSRWTLAGVATAACVAGLALLGFVMGAYHLSYEGYWQDELTSVYAARGILQSGFPHLASGFPYPKAELYSYLLAVVIHFFGDGASVVRMVSVVEYVGCIGLTFFVGWKLFNRRVGLLAAALLVFSVMPLRLAREARMYTQAELGALLTLYFFFKATRPDARPRYIYLAMAATVCTYLSHEIAYAILPALVVYFFATQRLRWVRNRYWWIAGGAAIAIVLAQLLIVKLTTPLAVVSYSSLQPPVGFTTEGLGYYVGVFFHTLPQFTAEPQLTLAFVLACLVSLWSLIGRDVALRYVCVIFWVSLAVLVFTFGQAQDRYLVTLLPQLALLAAVALVRLLGAFATLARTRLPRVAMVGVTAALSTLLIGTVLLSQIEPLTTFGLAPSRALGLPWVHYHPDYPPAAAYIKSHWQAGDILVAAGPGILSAYFIKTPDFVIYQEQATYVFERDGHLLDAYTGAPIIVNAEDLQALQARYHRIWILTSVPHECCGYIGSLNISQHFQLVFEGSTSLVYLGP